MHIIKCVFQIMTLYGRMKIDYRPDIDGLRGVAVLLVVLFHLELVGITGGYIGVDVFFVISGFLITSIIIKELEAGHFSLFDFYERRVRRIFPALFVVLFASLIASYLILFPQSFADFGASLAASSMFGANIYFWKEAGYFETESGLVPLLHMWSLGVEEQFYIFFPLFLMFIYKNCKKWLVPLTIAGGLLSVLIACFGLEFGKYAAVFYLLPARAWELLIGSLLAFGFIPAVRNKLSANVMASLGFASIMFAAFYYNEDTLFPGFFALLPTLGAAMLIYACGYGQTFLGNVLSGNTPIFRVAQK
jgi:peptidoglycan/LPS O-acetylase OafA/YrhL